MAPFYCIQNQHIESAIIYYFNTSLQFLHPTPHTKMQSRQQKGVMDVQCRENGYKDKLIFYEGVNIVGRNPSKTIVTIKDRSVSEIHAKVICKDKTIKVMDANSKNGVYINEGDIKLTQNQEVQIDPQKDFVFFGQVKCKFVPDWPAKNIEQKQFNTQTSKYKKKGSSSSPSPIKPSLQQKQLTMQQKKTKNKQSQENINEQKNIKKQSKTKEKQNAQEMIKDNKKTKKQQVNKNDKTKQNEELLKTVLEDNIIKEAETNQQQEQQKVIKKKSKKESKQKTTKQTSKEKDSDKNKRGEGKEKLREQKNGIKSKQIQKKKVQFEKQETKKQKINKKVIERAPAKHSQKSTGKQKSAQQNRQQAAVIQNKQKRNESGETKVRGKGQKKAKSAGKQTNEGTKNQFKSKKRMPDPLNQSFNSYPKRTILQKTALLSGFNLAFTPTTKITITENWRDSFDVLVMEKYSRTFKLLFAICLGIPVVSINWILESEYKRGIVPFERFFLQGPQKDVIISSVTSGKNGNKVFKDLKFYLIQTEEPFHLPIQQIQALIQAGGGTLVKKISKKTNEIKEIIFIMKMDYGDNDIKALKKIEGAEKIYTVQMIMDSCLYQEIKWSENRISKF